MRIGEVARESGVGVETVRFYELKGLIERPLRPDNGGYRNYPADVVRRITFIRRAQNLGFSLVEIAELLELEAGRNATCTDIRNRAEAKRAEVERKAEGLRRIRQALDVLIAACPGKGPARSCSIIEAINKGELYLDPTPDGGINGRHQAKD